MGLGQSDFELLLSNEQAVTTTALCEAPHDLGPLTAGNTTRNLGALGDIWLMIICREAVTSGGGSATVTFTLESDSTSAMSSATTHLTTVAIGQATLINNYVVIKTPVPNEDYEEWIGVRYTVGSGPLTAGKFTAFLGTQPFVLKQHSHALDFA